jgi:sirohydrochlorin cobaltochelatase
MESSDATLPGPTAGLLLVGHGTREPAGVAEFDALARKIAARAAPTPVAACFLELAEPDIATGIERLAGQGIGRVTVVPVLLFAAGHAKRDIPEAVAAAIAGRSGMTVRQAPHLGLDAGVLALAVRRFAEAIGAADARLLAKAAPIDPEQTLLVVVGRGSRDPEALAEFHEFARRLAAAVGCPNLQIAFLAMAEPTLDGALSAAAAGPHRRIIVQPHLLFGGVLVDRVRDVVAGRQAATPDKQWVSTDHLGPDDLLVEALVEAASVTAGFAQGR